MNPAFAMLVDTLGDAAPPLDWDLGTIRDGWSLSPFECDLLLLAALPDLDAAWGDAFAALGQLGRRPSLGFALRTLVPAPAQRRRVAARLGESALFTRGLLRLSPGDMPRPDRPLRVVGAVLAALEGRLPDRLDGVGLVRVGRAAQGEAWLRARPSFARLVEGLATSLTRGATVHCPDPTRAVALAEALAFRLGRELIHTTDVADTGAEEIVVLAATRRALVLAELRSDVRRVLLPAGAGHGMVVWATHADATVEAPPELLVRVALPPPPTPPEMATLWELALARGGATANVDLLANQNRLDPALLDRAVALATSAAQARDADHAEHADIVDALGELRRDPPLAMAAVTRPKVPWEAVLLPAATRSQLEELRLRVEHRLTVQHRWGMGSSSGRGDGVVALLHGESGTGKTHAAEALATALGLSLVRIDLSRVVSKYIGETEKNLAGVFAEAEGFSALLFFDEADAVFGKRTGVRDAHDRYANIETNYLLQRLESFEGVAILATNLLQNLDDAFLRRLSFVIHLPRPTAPVRRALWALHLPEIVRGPGLDLAELGTRYDLVGGEIRNAALGAAYAAAAARGHVTPERAVEAIRRELAKKGRPLPNS